jgi:hypothetical protein
MPKQRQQQNDRKRNAQDPQQSTSTETHLALLKLRHKFSMCRANNSTSTEEFHCPDAAESVFCGCRRGYEVSAVAPDQPSCSNVHALSSFATTKSPGESMCRITLPARHRPNDRLAAELREGAAAW